MKKPIYLTALFILSLVSLGFGLDEQNVTTRDLINNMDKYNNTDIVIKGEVIGDMMKRGNFVWFNIQDQFNVIGVWAPAKITSMITQAGDYQHRGDIIEVEGKFVKADAELKGELCIRASKIKILQQGHTTFHSLKPLKIKVSLVLSFIALFLALVIVWTKAKTDKYKKRKGA